MCCFVWRFSAAGTWRAQSMWTGHATRHRPRQGACTKKAVRSVRAKSWSCVALRFTGFDYCLEKLIAVSMSILLSGLWQKASMWRLATKQIDFADCDKHASMWRLATKHFDFADCDKLASMCRLATKHFETLHSVNRTSMWRLATKHCVVCIW